MDEINIYKSSLLEYINIIEGTINTFFNQYENDNNQLYKQVKNEYSTIKQLRKIVIDASNLDLLKSIKESIINIEKKLTTYIYEYKVSKLSQRELALIKRGYNVDEVISLNSIDNRQINNIANDIFKIISRNCKEDKDPICIYLGGQPGAGKSSRSMKLKSQKFENDFVEIGIDNYRTYHPNYLEIEKTIRKHWENRIPTNNDSPGNDIADFTHNFAGKITDILTELASKKRYNILFEWGMREPFGPLKTMQQLHRLGYKNIVDFIAVHKNVSLMACNMRAEIMNNQKHIIRKVPEYFHEKCVESLPESCQTIYEMGYLNDKIIDSFTITTRDKDIIFDALKQNNPKTVYNEYLHNPKLSITQTNDEKFVMEAYQKETEGINQEIEKMIIEKNSNDEDNNNKKGIR